jgi:cytochrome c oxidase subunit 2
MKNFFGFPWLPMEASSQASAVDDMIVYVHWLMLVLAIGWSIYFVYVLFRFRAKKNPHAQYVGASGLYSKYVEMGVILAEIVLLFGFSVPIWAELTKNFPELENAIEVGIVAEQFAWNFHYPGPDGRFGSRNPQLVDAQANILGLDRENDEAAKDDFTTHVLHLAVNKPVIAHVTSKDVIHSLGIPAMRVKQDAIPGMTIPVTFTPNREGKFLIACSQLCGSAHALMRGFIDVHSKEGFEAWQKEQTSPAQIGETEPSDTPSEEVSQ